MSLLEDSDRDWSWPCSCGRTESICCEKSSASDHILVVPTSLHVHRRCVRAKSDKGASEETWQSLCSMAANRSGYRLSANQVLPGGKVMV